MESNEQPNSSRQPAGDEASKATAEASGIETTSPESLAIEEESSIVARTRQGTRMASSIRARTKAIKLRAKVLEILNMYESNPSRPLTAFMC
ncbi:hypothetical protein RUND412_003323 [Rhizina undulata]